MMLMSVIIPTHNRKESLARVLEEYSKQTVKPDCFEIIISDDGSTDGTDKFIKEESKKYKFRIVYCKQEKNVGPAKIRNIAIVKASGKYVLFTGDDIIPSQNFLEEHLESHKKHNGVAVLGFTDWFNGIEISEFMKFISEGYQFNYSKLRDGGYCDYSDFYTSNISLEKKWLDRELFDENIPYPASEDVELGYRLEKIGLKIIFNKKALAFHNHIITEDEFYRKSLYNGRVLIYLYKKHPEMRNLTLFLLKTRVAYYLYLPLFALAKISNDKKQIWKVNIRHNVAKGAIEGIKPRQQA